MIRTEEFDSGKTLELFRELDKRKVYNQKFYSELSAEIDMKSKKHHQCKYHEYLLQEEEPDGYRDNLENR